MATTADADIHIAETGTVLEVRDLDQREIGIRIVPWNVVADTRDGPEVFVRGAFDGIDPTKVVLRMDHQNPPAGRGISLEDREDGAYMAFRVSKTQRGDEILALAVDGVATGASVGYSSSGSKVDLQAIDGRRTRVVRRSALREVSTTWLPTWDESAVVYVRSIPEATEEGDAPVSDTAPVVEAPSAPAIDLAPLTEALTGQTAAMQRTLESFGERIAEIEERSRKDFRIPAPEDKPSARSRRGDWMSAVLQMLSGERVNDLQMRALDDIITTDSVGVVPDAFLSEIIGVIDPRRPFLQSTRRLDLPPAGMSLVVPKIVTRPETGVQETEKTDIASNTTSITTATFDAVTIAGGGDISLQLLKRSSPSFLSLYLELLAESYARNAEIQALTALYTGDTPGGTLDPEEANFGQAWANGAAVGQQVDTLWLSSNGVARFIDAKADGTNAPLYSTIQAGFTAGSGPAGTISGLRPVYVPAMDAVGDVDAIVGPSSGFGWTEDGTYTLQVDVPAKAGRDVAIVGILWFAPMYPSAFTTYQIAS
ncbi:MAG TPA: phage major capsid protein [Solirubrobacterales bacterium]